MSLEVVNNPILKVEMLDRLIFEVAMI